MSTTSTPPVTGPAMQAPTSHFFARLLKEKHLGTVCGVVLLGLLVIAIFAPALAPTHHEEINPRDRLQRPSAQYPLGTDQLGRNYLSLLIWGARISLLVGLAITTLNVTVALIIGGTSGFIGGRLDLAVQRFVDAWMCFPGLILLLTVMSVVGQGLVQIIMVLGIAGGIGSSRIIRGAVIGVKENLYFQAAEAIGSPTTRTLLRHVVPNIAPPVIIVFSISVGGNILSVASLSFLGYGLPATLPEWGGLLSREGRRYMEIAPWMALWPGLCLTVVIYCMNMFGDAVRDLLDPRLRGGVGNLGARSARLAARAKAKALTRSAHE